MITNAKQIQSIESAIALCLDGLEKHRLAVVDINTSLKKYREQLARLKFGVEVGSVVSYENVEYRVVAISFNYLKPWIVGNPRKKNGEWSKAERNLFSDWKLVSKESPSITQ
jgi:hypothetical protein